MFGLQMKKLFILGMFFTSLALSAFSTTVKEAPVEVIDDYNYSNVNKFIYSEEFSNYLSKFEKNLKQDEVIRKLVLTNHLKDIIKKTTIIRQNCLIKTESQ